MSSNRFTITRSKIDSDRFGVPVARAWYPSSEKDLAALEQFCRREKIRLCIARLGSQDVHTAGQLAQKGFFITDRLTTWALALPAPAEPSGTVPIRPGRPDDSDAVIAIARAAFENYASHYHNDSKLDRKAVSEVYPDWARRAVSQSHEHHVVLVSETDHALAGFAALLLKAPRVVVDLIAVHPRFQRRGHLRSLLLAAAAWAQSKDAQELTIAAQSSNLAVEKTCTRLSFLPGESTQTLHGWLE